MALIKAMCGRAAQTQQSVQVAARMLGGTAEAKLDAAKAKSIPGEGESSTSSGNSDNFNMSPGMKAWVFLLDEESNTIDCRKMAWGLVTKPGSKQHPLPPSSSPKRLGLHFSNLMYNARTDTLFEKPTFSRLISKKRSCLVALTGYFEWKAAALKGDKKQPYFVSSKNEGTDSFLLLPGLWNVVSTGLEDEPLLETFTVLTTDANAQISWLHHRMPVCLWEPHQLKEKSSLAWQWLVQPSPRVLEQLELQNKNNKNDLHTHPVTKEMTSLTFRGKQALEPIKMPKTMTSFFSPVASPNQKNKRRTEDLKSAVSSDGKGAKKPRKDKITAFFSPSNKSHAS